jgi:hypothetical protein
MMALVALAPTVTSRKGSLSSSRMISIRWWCRSPSVLGEAV